jgi:hypothetical protein
VTCARFSATRSTPARASSRSSAKATGAEAPVVDAHYGRVSYTQFEFLYACEKKKKTWLFFAADTSTRDTPTERLDLPELGRVWVRAMKKPTKRAILRARPERLKPSPDWIFALAERIAAHSLFFACQWRPAQCVNKHKIFHLQLLSELKSDNSSRSSASKKEFIAVRSNAEKNRRRRTRPSYHMRTADLFCHCEINRGMSCRLE